MSYDTLGMIRRGWQDGAATVAPHVPGLADLLERRLGEATRLGQLDEASLLAIVDAATQLAADSGAVDVAPALSKRLRRHVYEYLLSLDAVGNATPATPAWQDPSRDSRGPLIGAEEAVSMSRAQIPETDNAIAEANGGAPHRPLPTPSIPEEDEDTESAEQPPSPTLPQFGFHIGDPDDFLPNHTTPEEAGPATTTPEASDPFAAGDLDALADSDVPPPHRASFSDPSTWPKPVPPMLRESHDSPGIASRSSPDGTSFEDLSSWPSESSIDSVIPSEFEDLAHWAAPWLIPKTTTGQHHDEVSPGTTPAPGASDFGPASVQLPRDLHEERGHGPGAAGHNVPTPTMPSNWSVRQPEAVDLNPAPPLDARPTMPAFPSSDVPERALIGLRAAVEEKLRRKRCDDTAAMLQQAAQELGGEAVAELALDAGDRCRTLGKRNAALNCYLAASRADPVFEPPLARLADICIDDHDIDLAVSYLERIARLTRLRNDTRGAVRIYRRIAAIAPYRDDVLEMLMRAQTTGRLDP
jgi:hypothetical protein